MHPKTATIASPNIMELSVSTPCTEGRTVVVYFQPTAVHTIGIPITTSLLCRHAQGGPLEFHNCQSMFVGGDHERRYFRTSILQWAGEIVVI